MIEIKSKTIMATTISDIFLNLGFIPIPPQSGNAYFPSTDFKTN